MREIINTQSHSVLSVAEKALAMYKETVSPSRVMLVNVLNQLRVYEKISASNRRAIRSPYIWVAITQMVSVCVIALAVYPTFAPKPTPSPATLAYHNDPFYAVDSQVDAFEEKINQEDYQALAQNYTP